MESEGKSVKKLITDEERLQLAAKLDKELDEFIEKLPKKKYEDGWPEDCWEEEMNKHPFFMKKPPKPGDDLHPLYEGLQQLKYDPEENEPDELALNYKEDGNFNFKYKNYRLAVVAYTEGIKINCGNPEIQATLLNNRAAAHYFLKNFRSCLKDCQLALAEKPDYDKALIRAAKCCYELKNYRKAVDYFDQILEKDKYNKEIQALRQKSISSASQKERDERKSEAIERRKAKEKTEIIKEILKRGYNIEGGQQGELSLEKLEPSFPQLMHNQVHLDVNYNLVWPVTLLYPEYKIMDFISNFNEQETLAEHFVDVFDGEQEWDHEKKYKAENVNAYYETPKKKIIKVNVNATLQDVLKMEGYVIRGGTPSFLVFVKNSAAEEGFLKNY